MQTHPPTLPGAFIMRRLHSLFGLWLVLYLVEHLFTNANAALYFANSGSSFISLVNRIKDLPFLSSIEILFLGIPFLIHGIWGVIYLLTARYNSFPGPLDKPVLSHYGRNHAYTFQRLTSWVLLVAIVLHVVQMRFIEAPKEGSGGVHLIEIQEDAKLAEVAGRIGVVLKEGPKGVVAESAKSGPLFLLSLRTIFKSLWMDILYSLFVLVACFHAFNGLWTFMISWGITRTAASQKAMRIATNLLMALVAFFGLAAIWGVYFNFWWRHG